MTMPGHFSRVDGVPALVKSAVLFLDVLGTSEFSTDRNAPSTLVELDAALAIARERSQLDDDSSWADSAWFSDNLAIAAPLGTNSVFEEGIIGNIFIATIWLQFILAIKGFFIRGGFTIGDHFMDDRVNFGPALVRAVELEKNAVFPRIVIDDASLEVVAGHSSHHADGATNPFESELMVDEDGYTFLSYLSVTDEADDPAEAIHLLQLHHDALAGKLIEHPVEGAIRSKYLWATKYHNAYCLQIDPQGNHPQLLIAVDSPSRTFERYQTPH